MNNSARSAEQQKTQRAEKINSRILKQTHDVQLAETFKPLTNKLRQIFEKPDSEDGNTQITSIQNVTSSQSLPDTLILIKRSKKFFKLVERTNRDVFCHGVHIKALGGNKISVLEKKYDITPAIQVYLIKTCLTTKPMNIEDKSMVLDSLEKTGFYC